MIELTQISIYPVKSCRGITLTRTELTPYGLMNDRRWMVVDAQGTFLSQRTLPKMALIETFLSREGLSLKAPGSEPIEIPYVFGKNNTRTIRIWDDTCTATDCGDEAGDWLSKFLGVQSRLVTMGEDFERQVSPKYSTQRDQVGFADAFPVLLISSASLRDLNERLDLPVPMNRFRPNLVVSGCEPFAEDNWKRIAIGSTTFTIVKPCARCTVPTVDQMTATTGDEPLSTLSTYRRGEKNAVFFGQNLVNHQKSGEVVLGSEVQILQQS